MILYLSNRYYFILKSMTFPVHVKSPKHDYVAFTEHCKHLTKSKYLLAPLWNGSLTISLFLPDAREGNVMLFRIRSYLWESASREKSYHISHNIDCATSKDFVGSNPTPLLRLLTFKNSDETKGMNNFVCMILFKGPLFSSPF